MPPIGDPKSIYLICLGALAIAGVVVALVAGPLSASVVFFLVSLVLMAGFFVF